MISGQFENLMIFSTFWRFFKISRQCENLMIFKLFDGFSWFLGNVKISWFSTFLTVFHDFWKKSRFLNTGGFSWFLGNV
jgi:hypothetical protein